MSLIKKFAASTNKLQPTRNIKQKRCWLLKKENARECKFGLIIIRTSILLMLLAMDSRNMSGAGASDSSTVEKLKNLLTKYGTELLKPCDSTEKLLRRLDKLEHLLSNTSQRDRKLVEMSFQLPKEALISDELIKHSELDVRVSVASCISHIIRITAPDEPFEEDHMKEYFQLVISAFMRLPCMSGRAYSKAVGIVHTMSVFQSCVMMLDLELYATVDHMFHLFLDGIRNKHPNKVFSSMEKIMSMIIQNNVDNDEFSLVLVRILLNRLRRKNQNVSPVSFQLALNTFKNCSDKLKKYLPETVTCLDFPIDDYAEVVVLCFQDATQREIKGSEDTVENVESPVEAGLAIETDLCNFMEGNETQNPKSDANYNENQRTISHCSDDPDKVGESMNMQQEQNPEETNIGRKRNRRPSCLLKPEEGYDPHWMWFDWRTMKGLGRKRKTNTDNPTKSKKLKDFSPKRAGENIGDPISSKRGKVREHSERNEEVSANEALEPNSEGKIVAPEDQKDFSIKSSSDKGQGSPMKIASLKKSRKKTTVSEDLNDDIMTSASQHRSTSSQARALSTDVSKQKSKGSVTRLKKRNASGPFGKEMIGCRIKVWWPLDQEFYKATIVGYNPEVKYHRVEYDDGEIELVILSEERWELIENSKLSAQEQENIASSSFKAK